jgi:CRISPR-associated protein Csx14
MHNAANVDTSPAAMVATLGGKPQVVTFALDALLHQGTPIERVCVVHLSSNDPRIRRSLGLLKQDLIARLGAHAPLFESIPIRAEPPITPGGTYAATQGRPIEQIHEPAAPDAIWMTMHRLIATLKAEGYRIELCLTGGPRLISLQALSAAALLLTGQDHCWHLYTPEDLRAQAGEGKIMHAAPGSGVRLVSVPLLPMGLFVPGLRQAAFMAPEQFMAAATQRLNSADAQRCHAVICQLTPRQREVLRAFAQGARSAADVGRQLSIGVSTVRTHLGAILGECRNAWELPAGEKLDFHFLREHFGPLDDSIMDPP